MKNKRAEKGFTLVETITAAIIIGILAAYAAPKLFAAKSRADAAAEAKAIKGIEALHATAILDGKGRRPTLSGLVGYRAATNPLEDFPDERPVLIDYGYSFQLGGNPSGPTLGEEPSSNILTRCSELNNFVPQLATHTNRYRIPDGGYDVLPYRAFSAIGVTGPVSDYVSFSPEGDDDVGVSVDARPACRVYAVGHWHMQGEGLQSNWNRQPRWDALAGYGLTFVFRNALSSDPLFLNSRPADSLYRVSSERKKMTIGHKLFTSSGVSVGSMPHGDVDVYPPSFRRRTCEPYNVSGVSYIYAGPNKDPDRNATRIEKADASYSVASGVKSFVPASVGVSVCKRDTPEEDLPPADPGDPGLYPPASDGSGLCVAPGRKLPTFGRDGSPTSSLDDEVHDIGVTAVSDEDNCPE